MTGASTSRETSESDSDHRLVVAALGVPSLRIGGEEHLVRGDQPRLLMVRLLVARGSTVSVEQLIETLWGERAAPHQEAAVRGVASKVRRALAAAGDAVRVESVGGSYRLVLDDSVVVDLWAAEDAIDDGERSAAAGRPQKALGHARRVLSLLEAPLLVELDAPWIDAVRRRVFATRCRAHRLACEELARQGLHEATADQARSWLVDDPFDELAHRHLISALASSGQRAPALRAYESCRRLLAAELGTRPAPATEQLYMELLGPTDGTALRPPPTEVSRRFVGRADELAALDGAWRAAVAGDPQIVLLMGEGGVGKTRLALEALRIAEPVNALYGRCSGDHIVPYEPFVEAIGTQIARLDDDELRTLLHPFEREMSALVPAVGLRLHQDDAPAGNGDNRARVFDAVRSLVSRAAQRPTAAIIDDLHHADGSTLDLLRHVVSRVPGARLLLIFTCRDDLDLAPATASAVAALTRADGCRVVRLRGLDPEEIEQMLPTSALRDEVAADLASAIHMRTAGNAFYVTQLVRTITDRGGAAELDDVPDSVAYVIKSQLAALPSAARATLDLAALIGTSIPRRVLDAAVGPTADVDEQVERLIAARLLVDSSARELAFAHAIVRDVVIRSMSAARRRRLHLTIADAITALGTSTPELAPLLANQLELASDPSVAGRLVDALTVAARAAFVACAYAESAALLDRALTASDSMPRDATRSAELLLRRGAALRRHGDFIGARAALEHALDLAREIDAGVLFADTVLELVSRGGRGVIPNVGQPEQMALLEEALRRLHGAEPALEASLLADLTVGYMLTGQRADLERTAGLAQELVDRTTDANVAALAMPASRLLLAHPSRAADRSRQVEELLSAMSVAPSEQRVRLLTWQVADRLELGDRRGFDLAVVALKAASAQLRQPYWLWVADAWQACHRFVSVGDGAVEEAEAALRHLAGIEHQEASMSAALQAAIFLLHDGRGADVADLWTLAAQYYPLPSVRSALALARAQAGDLDGARAEYDPLLAMVRSGLDVDFLWAVTVAGLAETTVLLGDRAAARMLIPLLAPAADRFIVVSVFGAGGCWGPFSAPLAGLHALIGEPEIAAKYYDDALDVLERFRSPRLTARVRRSRALMLG